MIMDHGQRNPTAPFHRNASFAAIRSGSAAFAEFTMRWENR